MTVRNLNKLFHPESVAIVGASQTPRSVGATLLQNMVEAGFAGPIYPVNPKYSSLLGLKTYKRLSDLPQAPDLAIICTPPATVPGLIAELGALGGKAAVVLTAGLSAPAPGGGSLQQAMLAAARPHLLRILGPNCVGMLAPGIGVNASFAHTGALPGKIAFVSQSGALVTGVLDWAKSRGIGFSKFVSLGDGADIDFGDMLDYLANDNDTHAILLYIEGVTAARKFMSAARAAARSKPVIVVKAGRAPEGAKAASSHTGSLAGSDAVYDAAIRRAGMLRVFSTEDLFDAVETLARSRPLSGGRLAIMTNGGGLGVMATDELVAKGGKLAQLSAAGLERLDGFLPKTWSRGNPVDIIGDAPGARYVGAMQVLLDEPEADALLFLHAPTAIVPSTEIAREVLPLAQAAQRNVLSCWLGGDTVAPARRLFSEAGLPTYDTPEKAVHGFMQMVQYRRNQDLLMQAPAAEPAVRVDRAAAREVVRAALEAGRTLLSEPEAKAVLAAYGIPVVRTMVARSVEQALELAERIGYPVALKIMSPQLSHKSDVGGVVLDLEHADALRAAAESMLRRLRALRPDASLEGFSVQAMARRPQALELIVGMSTDPVFGPVLLFGQGGVAVEVMADHAIGLPPLNMALARDMVGRTRVSKLLAGYRNRPPADLDAIDGCLVQVAHLVADLPEVVELDINPLLADAAGVVALDARIKLVPLPARAAHGGSKAAAAGSAAAGAAGASEASEVTEATGATEATDARLAIRPYPDVLEEWIDWHGEDLMLRPIKPEDGAQHLAFFNALTPEDVRMRAFSSLRELQRPQLARLTQIDYDREMAFIAERATAEGGHETLGVARAVADPDNLRAEFAIIIRSDLKGKGLGGILLKKLVEYFRGRGTLEMVGEALAGNDAVQDLVKRFGFEVEPRREDGTVALSLRLN